jgi:phosphoribosylpyrophosphate synthetase
MNNIDFSKKYLKYKNKYLERKSETLQIGGACTNQYILLSCNEFNDVVDQIIDIDKKNYPDSDPLIIKNIEDDVLLNQIKKHFIDHNIYSNKDDEKNIKCFDTFCSNTYNKFYKFAKDIGINLIDTFNSEDSLNLIVNNFYRNQTIYQSKNFYRGYINWKTYSDLSPDIKMNANTIKYIRGSKIIFFAYFSFNEPNVTPIITQLLFLNSLNHYGVSEINIVLPYFPVGTMERIVGEGEIPTAYSLAHMLNMIPSGASKNNLYIFDIHALCSRFFFHTNTRPVLISMMPSFIDKIEKLSTECKSIIVFPDDGAKKRFEKLIDPKIKTITCSKTRIGDIRKIRIDTGFEYFQDGTITKDEKINLFLIDDLVQTGGTLVETFKGLYEQLEELDYNLTNINCYAIVTHSVFPDDIKTQKFFTAKYKSKKWEIPLNIHLITTNSRPMCVKKLASKSNISILNIDEPLYQIFTKECGNTPYIAPYSIN